MERNVTLMDCFDPEYEYNAPTFVDFTEPSEFNDDDADSWFDLQTSTATTKRMFEEPVESAPTRSLTAESSGLTGKDDGELGNHPQAVQPVAGKCLSNVVTSLSAWKRGGTQSRIQKTADCEVCKPCENVHVKDDNNVDPNHAASDLESDDQSKSAKKETLAAENNDTVTVPVGLSGSTGRVRRSATRKKSSEPTETIIASSSIPSVEGSEASVDLKISTDEDTVKKDLIMPTKECATKTEENSLDKNASKAAVRSNEEIASSTASPRLKHTKLTKDNKMPAIISNQDTNADKLGHVRSHQKEAQDVVNGTLVSKSTPQKAKKGKRTLGDSQYSRQALSVEKHVQKLRSCSVDRKSGRVLFDASQAKSTDKVRKVRHRSLSADRHPQVQLSDQKSKCAYDAGRSRARTRSHDACNKQQLMSVMQLRSRSLNRTKPETSCKESSQDSIQRKRKSDAEKIAPIKPKVCKIDSGVDESHKQQRQHATLSKQLKSSEELGLEKVAEFRQALARHRKKAAKSLKLAKASTSYHPVQSAVPTTQPMQFEFETDKRIKDSAVPVEDHPDEDFIRSLLSRKSSGNEKQHVGPTVVKPFRLSENRTRKASGDSEASTKQEISFQPTAELILKFEKQTPERFRTKPRNAPPELPQFASKPKLTCAKTPNLQSKTRARPIAILSQSELEQKEMEEIRMHQFKAASLNPKILTNPGLGVKRIPAKPATIARSPDLEIEKRIHAREHKQDQEEKYEFKAKKLSEAILKGPVGIPKVEPQRLTQPESPAFNLRKRVRIVSPPPVKKDIKANPVPHTGIDFIPKLDHRKTEAMPFSFEQRDKEMMQHKEEKVKKIIEKTSKVEPFRAQPLPPTPQPLPPKKVMKPTLPQPFKVANKHPEDCAEKKEQELAEARKKAAFKARPCKVLHTEPFVPEKQVVPLTEVSQIVLNTERRSQQREEFEFYKKQKELEIAAVEAARRKQREEEEEQELQRLRKMAVPKANPIRKFRPVEIHSSDLPLTHPVSPKFTEKPHRDNV